MLLKRNILETLSIGCCGGTVFLIFLHSITNISPITGVWFPIYLVLLFFVSLVLSFRFLKWLLSLNRPVKYDLEGLVAQYPFLKCFMGSLLEVYKGLRRKSTQVPYKEYDTNELSVISSVLERKLVSSWYVPYISQEIGFPFACKQLLDQMIGKAFQICHKIDTKDVYTGVCLVFVTHLREYRRALQRHEKSPSTPVELYYKKSHYQFKDGNKYMTSGDHCVQILRLICKDLVPWELWDTPHSELIVRILSKRLDNFIETTLTNPVWLNDRLVTLLLSKNNVDSCKSENVKVAPPENTKNIEEEVIISKEMDERKKIEIRETEISEKSLKIDSEIQTSPAVNSIRLNVEQSIKVNGNHIGKEVYVPTIGIAEVMVPSSGPIDVQSSPVLRQRRGRQGRNEVKIYDKIIEGSVKTWETDVDLRCCSLGQDLLATLDGEITLSRLWEQDTEMEVSPNPPRKSPHQLWFGEEDQLDLELPETPRSPTSKQHSPKSAELLLKDLASSVSTAKTKLEGFQVDLSNGARGTTQPGDEAAGMMEGLLDFGIAGFKKGLRFTGLSDETQAQPQGKDKSPVVHHRAQPIDNTSPTNVAAERSETNEEIHSDVEMHKDENMALPILQKQQRVASQESMGMMSLEPVAGAHAGETPGGGEVRGGGGDVREGGGDVRGGGGGGTRSPSPQYEEVTDLSATIAKLRSLLNDRSEEVILWEGAEETQGHVARHKHARVEAATRADEYDMNSERNSSPNQVANNMQKLDKLLRGTVSGVFNSLRGAVGGDEGSGEGTGEGTTRARDWHYVTHRADTGVSRSISRAVCRVRTLSPADAALDSLSLTAHGADTQRHTQPHAHLDLEEWLVVSGWRTSGVAETVAALGAVHVLHTALLLLLHDIIDPLITQWLEDHTSWLRLQVFQQFEQMSAEESSSAAPAPAQELREMDLEYTCRLIMEKIPGILQLLGEDTLKESVKTVTSSLSHKEVNRDVAYRLLDVFALHFHHAVNVRNPSFDS